MWLTSVSASLVQSLIPSTDLQRTGKTRGEFLVTLVCLVLNC